MLLFTFKCLFIVLGFDRREWDCTTIVLSLSSFKRISLRVAHLEGANSVDYIPIGLRPSAIIYVFIWKTIHVIRGLEYAYFGFFSFFFLYFHRKHWFFLVHDC